MPFCNPPATLVAHDTEKCCTGLPGPLQSTMAVLKERRRSSRSAPREFTMTMTAYILGAIIGRLLDVLVVYTVSYPIWRAARKLRDYVERH